MTVIAWRKRSYLTMHYDKAEKAHEARRYLFTVRKHIFFIYLLYNKLSSLIVLVGNKSNIIVVINMNKYQMS